MKALPVMTHAHGGCLLVSAFLLSGLLLSISSCKKDPIGPSPGGLDTTSHSFSWTAQTFGDEATSCFRDVAIINDSLAYAVGAVYKKDSIGNSDPHAYNVARWNGTSWQLMRVMFPLCAPDGTQNGSGPVGATSIFAISANDIWITCTSSLVHWNGRIFEPVCMTLGYGLRSFSKLWGRDGQLFLGGTDGFIAHYNGVDWHQLSSGTSLDIRDIYGAQNAQTGSWEVMAIASNQYTSLERRILRITGLTVEALADTPLTEPLTTCWFVPGTRYLVAGSGIYEKGGLEENMWRTTPGNGTHSYVEAIRGTAANDIFAVGDFGECVHYSGRTWKSYVDQTGIASGAYYAVATKGRLVIAVGISNPRAVILMGTRVP
jgi:hypothetical protein